MASPARAAKAVFSVAVGYNGVPVGASNDMRTLRFADDDAAAFHLFARGLAQRSYLLTVFDPDTQRRFPDLAGEVRPPSRGELARVWRELETEIAAATSRGDETAVLIFYSGHGTLDAGGRSALTLVDGSLDRSALYDELLAPLRARFIHLFVDACHAEAIVRPRDLQAQVVATSAPDIRDYLNHDTLARFPNVGAIIASTAGTQSHEWDAYQAGVFTHEILSALRGAADVDGNHRIEYSEVAAFLTAANREIADPRARPHTLIRSPQTNPRAVIVDLDQIRDTAWLEGAAGDLGTFFVEDARGNRIADFRAEQGFHVSLAIPAREAVFLHSARGETSVQPDAGARVRFENLRWTPADLRARGALETSLQRGLFATRFGPSYYRGYADNMTDLVAVQIADPASAPPDGSFPGAVRKPRAAWTALGVSTGVAVASAVFGGLAWQARDAFQSTNLERPAQDARNRYERDLTISLSALVGAALAGGLAAYLFTRNSQ